MEIPEGRRQRVRGRFPCNLDVVINDSLPCKAFDISEGGMYVKTDATLTPGKVVRLSLPFQGGRLEISARIKYCLEGVGMGLMFIDLNDALKGKIKTLVQDIKEAKESGH